MSYFFGNDKQLNIKDVYRLAKSYLKVMEDEVLPKAKKHNASNGDTPKLTVETFDNHIYFYSDVDSDRCLALMKQLREVDLRLRNERVSREIPDGENHIPIWLHINSGGGYLFDALATADQIKNIQTPIFSIVEGLCASAATLLSLSCKKRYITKNSFMLIHQFTSVKWGTYEQFVDEMNLQEMLMENLIRFYQEMTKFNAKSLKEILKRDSWYNASQCLESGLVDEIK